LPIASLITFLPSIKLTQKIGRKLTVIIGLVILVAVLLLCGLLAPVLGIYFVMPMFALAGIGWAMIMANAFPMFVEIATEKNLGRMTGYYYIVAQGSQFLTAIVCGFIFTAKYGFGLKFYFWYALIFMVMALALCFFYKTKKTPKKA